MINNKTLLIGINLGDYGSTGAIMINSFEYAKRNGNYDYLIITPDKSNVPNSFYYRYKRNIIQKMIDRYIFLCKYKPEGFKYYFYTKRIIQTINKNRKKYSQCLIHLHNLHHADINLKSLFQYFKKNNLKIVFTLHDTWSFTGGCYFYDYIKCRSWARDVKCCCDCPLKFGNKLYRTDKTWLMKEKTFKLIKNNLTLVPVSHWLKKELESSFFNDYKTVVNLGECSFTNAVIKNNNQFIKKKIGILENDRLVISVSHYWNDWKGVKFLYLLAKKLPNNYKLLIVGGTLNMKLLPNMIHISNIDNKDLIDYYLASDCFASITQSDNLPLVLMEAQICGLPIVGFGYGGTPEEIVEGKTGYMIGKDNNIDLMIEKIKEVCEKNPFRKKDIIENGMRFAKYESAKRYLYLYDKTK